MKEIIIVTGILGGGGAERVFVNLANAFAERGHAVRIVITGTKKSSSYELDHRVSVDKVVSENSQKVLKIAEKIKRLRAYFKAHKGASIISFFPDVSAYCILASAGLGMRNILSERNDPYTTPKNKYKHMLRDIVFRFADVCVFQTEDARCYFPAAVRSKGVVINNPMNLAKVPMVQPGQKKRKVIIGIGRINPQKNFLLLIKAFERIRERFPEYIVEIYGEVGELSLEVTEYIRKNALEDCVKLMGFSENIYQHLLESEVYVLSSDYEGVSNTMLEALAMGVPTIATDCPIGGTRRFIQDGVNGYLVSVNDVEQMANALEGLLGNAELQEAFRRKSVEIRKQVDVDKVCDDWLAIL